MAQARPKNLPIIVKKDLADSCLRPLFWCQILVILLLCFCSSGLPAYAGIASKTSLSNIAFKRILNTTEADNAMQTALAIAQDPHGFIWMASELGLTRYDGHELKRYFHNPKNENSIPHNTVWGLAIDAHGTLWLGTNNGLSRYNPHSDSFVNYKIQTKFKNTLLAQSIRALSLDKDNRLLVGSESGFAIYDFTHDQLHSYGSDQPQDFYIPINAIRAIHQDASGDYWLGSATNGIIQLSNSLTPVLKNHYNHQPMRENSLAHNSVTTIAQDYLGVLWIGTLGGGVSQFNIQTQQFNNFTNDPNNKNSLGANTVWQIFEDSSQSLWLSSDHGGLNRFNRETRQFDRITHSPDDKNSIFTDNVRSIFEDRDGLLWVSTYPMGINLLSADSTQFTNLKHLQNNPYSLSNSSILNIISGDNDNLWIGTENGLNRLNTTTLKNTRYAAQPGVDGQLQFNAVLSLALRNNKELWVGTWSGGLHRFNVDQNHFTQFKPSAQQASLDGTYATPSDSYIWSLLADDDNLWIGTETRGLNRYRFSTGRFDYFEPQNTNQDRKISGAMIKSIVKDHDGAIWLATSNGLDRIAPKTEAITHFTQNKSDANSISGNSISALLVDSDNRLWVGTEGESISILDAARKNFTRIDISQFVPSGNIAAFSEDASGSIWATTDNGMLAINTETLAFKHVQESTGLVSNTFRRNALYFDQQNKLYAGSTEGLSIFSPEHFHPRKINTHVILTDCKILNTSITENAQTSAIVGPISETGQIHLNHDQSDISFSFSAFNFYDDKSIQYAYRLEGYDKDWRLTEHTNGATYTRLPPGKYQLKVKLAQQNSDPKITTINISVSAHPLLTPIAFVFYGIFFLGIAQLIWRNKMKQFELQKERQVNAQLIKLDQMKDTFLANTSHELRTPLNGIIGLSENLQFNLQNMLNEEQNKTFDMIIQSGRRLSFLINDILDMSKLGKQDIKLNLDVVDLQAEVQTVITLLTPLTSQKNIDLKNRIPNDCPNAVADKNRLQQILLNLIGNAIKYSDKGSINISAESDTTMISVSILDTGIGISENDLGTIFDSFTQVKHGDARAYEGTGLGLSITKQLVELHGGTISVRSGIGHGSTFTFSLPMASTNNSPTRDKPASHIKPSKTHEAQTLPTLTSNVVRTTGSITPLNYAGECTILCVDDNAVNMMVVTGILKLHGYKILEANGGKQALELFERHTIDLIVLDIMMPEISGYDVCREIRKTRSMRKLPILFLTAKDLASEKLQSLTFGGNDVLTKPINKHELLARVKNQLVMSKQKL